MRPREIDIHIDRIAMTAMPAGGERRLREAVARELTRLAGETRDGARWAEPGPAPAAAPKQGLGGELKPEGVAASIAGHVRAGLPRGSAR
jgi:hypothetical protein